MNINFKNEFQFTSCIFIYCRLCSKFVKQLQIFSQNRDTLCKTNVTHMYFTCVTNVPILKHTYLKNAHTLQMSIFLCCIGYELKYFLRNFDLDAKFCIKKSAFNAILIIINLILIRVTKVISKFLTNQNIFIP